MLIKNIKKENGEDVMTASENAPKIDTYVPFRDRKDFPPFSDFLKQKAEQDMYSLFYGFEREQQLKQEISHSGADNAQAQQKELKEILAIRESNKDKTPLAEQARAERVENLLNLVNTFPVP